jgi:DNA-directed RNA polymerase specialized sigma24 family protein
MAYNLGGICLSKVRVWELRVSSEETSVTGWIAQLQAGDPSAAQPLWERYFRRLIKLAHNRLQRVPRAAADEEDVALSAFASFCRGVQKGRFPQLSDRNELWRLLVVLTARKALHLLRDAHCQKRGGTLVSSPQPEAELEAIVGREPTPEFAAQVAEQCQRLLALLDTEQLRCIAIWKMEGYTVDQMADRLGCARTTVERRLRLIRHVWEKESEL